MVEFLALVVRRSRSIVPLQLSANFSYLLARKSPPCPSGIILGMVKDAISFFAIESLRWNGFEHHSLLPPLLVSEFIEDFDSAEKFILVNIVSSLESYPFFVR